MSQIPDQMANGNANANANASSRKSELDVYSEAVESSADGLDEFLESINLGLGNYSEKEYWMQIEAYKDYLYGSAAFERPLLERAIHETCIRIAEEDDKIRWVTEDGEVRTRNVPDRVKDASEEGYEPRRDYLRRIQRDVWSEMPVHIQRQYLEEKSGVDEAWVATHGRMIAARHEASRGKGARMIDNIFGRVKKFLGKNDGDIMKEGI